MNKLACQIDRCQKALQFFASRKKPGMAVVHDKSTGKTSYSKSPKATGVAGQFKMGKTGSGKEIHSYSHQSASHSWSKHDHMDAYRAHAKHVAHLDPDDTHPKLIQHHKAAMQHHWMQANKDIAKAMGELLWKAHPHSILGKTKSGKHIYAHHGHHKHKHFTSSDHKDASHLHHKRSMRIMDRLTRSKGKMKNALLRLLDKHSAGSHVHHYAAHGGK